MTFPTKVYVVLKKRHARNHRSTSIDHFIDVFYTRAQAEEKQAFMASVFKNCRFAIKEKTIIMPGLPVVINSLNKSKDDDNEPYRQDDSHQQRRAV
jgi:hypothetical protein